jgi:hypothetical protein
MLDTAPQATDHALQQDPAFLSALRLCGQTPVTLPGGLTLLSRRLFGIRVAMLPRAAPPPDLQSQLNSVGYGRTPVILSPETPCPDIKALRIRPPVTSATIDLTPDTASRRAALHGKWRNQLCRAEEGPLRIRSARLKPTHPILQLEEAQARTCRYVNWPRALTAAFAQSAPDQTRLFTAYLNGAPVSHMLFLLHGQRATYHIGHNSNEGRTHNGHNLLLWTASNWLARNGYTTLDLGLLHADTDSLNRFKIRAGAKALQTGGTWLRWRPLARRLASG